MQLTIYNSEDITLVRETRKLTFAMGMNPLQFSWANTLIDASSVDLRFVDHKDQLDLLDTTYPHDRPQLLQWNIKSEFEGEATVQITYFTSGISWAADYVCISDASETTMGFEGFVRINNNSGENYENAQVRLVVGTINLVEKVAALHSAASFPRRTRKRIAFKKAPGGAPPPPPMAAPAAPRRAAGKAYGDAVAGEMMDRKEIVKEGLSEYFIYTIEGTETIPNTWSRRLRLFEGLAVPFKEVYRFRPPSMATSSSGCSSSETTRRANSARHPCRMELFDCFAITAGTDSPF